ncbi:substrate-binding periplasmic protein [Marinimicrobium sp. ARAG 43.8]|uniref:substrate-binding periplasmic protein n=1 Tax=Marinimicrobium sp. ARAG 43.8 TaxID=3418719 RepID=UPI003CE9C443
MRLRTWKLYTAVWLVALGGLSLMAMPHRAAAVQETPVVVRYPWVEDTFSQNLSRYFRELLVLALRHSDLNYQLQPVRLSSFRESRSVMSVAKGLYDVHWMNANPLRERVLEPVRIPLTKGVIGWRLLLVRSGDRDRFAPVESVSDLQSMTAVQGHDWPDSDILERNGLKVLRTPSWEGMHRMLHAGRVDYFPRSVAEVWGERPLFQNLDVIVEPHLVLVYPSAYYFFVSQQNTALAEALRQGLEKAIEDGSFDRLFMAHFGDMLERADLKNRTLLRLENPLLTPETPLDRQELWYQP